MDRFLPTNWSKTLVAWALAILAGSIYHYFYPEPRETVYITWGVLTLAGIGISSALADWSSAGGRVVQIFWIMLAAGLVGVTAASQLGYAFPGLFTTDPFLVWSIACSAGYIVTALVIRSQPMFFAGLFSLFLIPVFDAPTLAPVSMLVFGIAHAGILLVLAF